MALTTLKAVADKEHATATAHAERARTRLAAADKELRAAQIASRAAAALFTDLSAKDAELRRRLAAAADGMPADTAALSDQVELNTVALRAQGAKARAAERAVASAKQAFLAAGEQARAAQAHLAAATEAKTAADARQKTLDDAKQALGQSPLKDVVDAATAALGDPIKVADTRIKGDVPDALLTRAKKRLELNGAELAQTQIAALDAAAAAATAAATANGLPAAAGKALGEMHAAERDYLATLDGDRAVHRAAAAIAAVSAAPPISAERRLRMFSGPVQQAGSAAATVKCEKDRDDARAAVLVKRTALDKKWVDALAADADADPAGNDDVKAARALLDEAIEALRVAEEVLDTPPSAGAATPRESFGRWEATVPAEIWNAVVALEGARATLTLLKATVPDTLAGKLAAAEDAYATALEKQGKGARAVEALAALAGERSAGADLAVRTNSDLSAVRGDL